MATGFRGKIHHGVEELVCEEIEPFKKDKDCMNTLITLTYQCNLIDAYGLDDSQLANVKRVKEALGFG